MHMNASIILGGWEEMTARFRQEELSMGQVCNHLRAHCTAFKRFDGNVDASIGSTLRFLEHRGCLEQVGRRKRSGPTFVLKSSTVMFSENTV